MSKNLRIVYMGTPDFAVEPLRKILEFNYEVAAVITSPDKPSGRGRQLSMSAVKQFALQKGLPVLQPLNLKAPEFIEELRSYQANLQVIVAFRMLPEVVWNMPEYGTFNLHASLLPQYRGAAPINWAIINGEAITGVTTFFLSHAIDTGNIIMNQEVPVLPDDTAGTLHDKLMIKGSELVIRTLEAIKNDHVHLISQESLIDKETISKSAPKIFKEDCRIDWNNPTLKIHNLIRGLSPYPAAYTHFVSPGSDIFQVKIFSSGIISNGMGIPPGNIKTNGRNYLNIGTGDGMINIRKLQVAGKKPLDVEEFLRGFRLSEAWHAM